MPSYIRPGDACASIFMTLYGRSASRLGRYHLRAPVERGDSNASGGRGFFSKISAMFFADRCLLFAHPAFLRLSAHSQIDEVLDFRRGAVKQLKKLRFSVK